MMKRIKFGLVGIILFGLSFVCFSNAEEVVIVPEPCVLYTGSVSGPSSINFNALDNTDNFIGVIFMGTWNNVGYPESSAFYGYYGQAGVTTYEDVSYNYYGIYFPLTGCSSIGGGSCSNGSGDCPVIDSNYCVENDLCPVPSNYSQLYINDIEHESAPLINITIPQEYDWESSINSGVFDLTISGYIVDYDYIDNIIRTQQSKPNSVDFNNIVSGLIPLLIPGLVIILFIWFIFRFIKKLF